MCPLVWHPRRRGGSNPVKDACPQTQSPVSTALVQGRRRRETPLSEMEKAFQLPKTYQMLLSRTKLLCFFLYFCPVFDFFQKAFFWGDITITTTGQMDGRTLVFRRQSKKTLLVKQETSSSNLTKLELFTTW